MLQALRRYARERAISQDDAGAALDDFQDLDLNRHAHEPLLARAWQLRENLTAYDAMYVALTEALDAVMITCDRPLSRVPALAGRVEVL